MSTCTLQDVGPRPYAELPPELQEQARKRWREKGWARDELDVERLSEQFVEELAESYGMEGMKVWWSLGSCQGDGVSFEGEPDIRQMAAVCDDGKGWHAMACRRLREIIDAAQVTAFMAGCRDDPEWRVVIRHEGHYYGWPSMNVNVYCQTAWGDIEVCQKTLDELADLAAEAVCEICSEACENLESQGYQEIDYLQSDDYLGDLLTANDQYLFDEEGELLE
jgi:hypothetical protein